MTLLDRLWPGRRDGGGGGARLAEPEGPIYLTDDAARVPRKDAALKAPTIREVHGGGRTRPPAAPDGDRPQQWAREDPGAPLKPHNASPEDRRLIRELFGGPEEAAAAPKPAPRPVVTKKRKDRSDFVIGALGIALGLTCALFPWYIFFNQDKFGVREFVFEGSRSTTPPSKIAYQPQLVGRPFQTGEVPRMDLDLFPTATVAPQDEQARSVPLSQQPFPADLVSFRLVHVANGRAMIQDDDGLWVVQPGSRLPDASHVAAIEQRDGSWVLVTSRDKVLALGR